MTMSSAEVTARKAALRKECLERRERLDARHARQAADAVRGRILAFPEYLSSRLIHTYVASLPNELDTRGVLDDSWKRGKQVVVPVVLGPGHLGHAYLEAGESLERDVWGILSPDPATARWLNDVSSIDMVLVPGVAFDLHGNRLGMGGGYYDRFLSEVGALRVGLTYSELLMDELPVQPHDVPVDVVVSPDAVIRARHG